MSRVFGLVTGRRYQFYYRVHKDETMNKIFRANFTPLHLYTLEDL